MKPFCLCSLATPAYLDKLRRLGLTPKTTRCRRCNAEVIASPGTLELVAAGSVELVCPACLPPDNYLMARTEGQRRDAARIARADAERN